MGLWLVQREAVQMSDMVERLTVVLGEQLAAAFTSGRPVVLSKIARAVFEATREPTHAMLQAHTAHGDFDHEEAALANWQAMIDAELK
jgi:hypothetical protein